MRALLKRYLKNSSGHFAVSFALIGIPLVVATTFVVDYSMASAEKVVVKGALDAAVIAAVNNNSLTISEKESYARTHFEQNYLGKIEFKLDAKASENRVEMSAFGVSPVTVAETLGIDGVEIDLMPEYENKILYKYTVSGPDGVMFTASAEMSRI